MRPDRSRWLAYGVAVFAVALAWGATLLFRIVYPERSLSLVFFFAAVAVSAGFGGLWPGALATLLSALVCDYFFLPPFHSLAVAGSDLPLLILFVLVALLINGLSERLRAGTRVADERFRDLVQGLDVIVWEGNPRTLEYTFVSQRAMDILGYPVSRWLSDPGFRAQILHPDDRDSILAEYRAAVQHAGDHEFEYRTIASDGRDVWLREKVYVNCDVYGTPVRLSGLCMDITERKKAAEELSAVKDELAALNGITAAVSTSLELPQVLSILKQQLAEQWNIRAGAIFLLDESEEKLRLAENWGLTEAWRQEIEMLPAGAFCEGNLVRARASRSRTGTTDIPPVVVPESAGASWEDHLAVPLIASGEVQGGIYLFDRVPFGLSTNRSSFFAALGRQLGVIVQNARLFEEVRTGQEHLRLLSRQLVRVQEAERRQIARELHDEIGQVLTGVKLSLETSLRLPPDVVAERLRQTLEVINELMVHVRDLSLDLRPAMLDDMGLLPTLLWHFQRYTALTSIRVVFEHAETERRFPHELETTAYRIVQEALTNTARHAGVNEVIVRLWATRDLLGVQVLDHGRGFSPETVLAGSNTGGLAGMQERTKLLGGLFTIESVAGKGACLTAELPLGASVTGAEER